MSGTAAGEASLVRQLSLAQATLDLCLDMERNQSDAQFAVRSKDNEIVYAFDESVFELFVGGHDEPEYGSGEGRVYQDRRRAVGIFNTREWRETPRIVDEPHRIDLNRQSAILTGEWLFSGTLPAMRNGAIHISRAHLQELRSRWDELLDLFRGVARTSSTQAREIAAVHRLLEDRASLALGGAGATSPKDVTDYIAAQTDSLHADLSDYWTALSADRARGPKEMVADFWRFAFSRRLAAELARMRAIGPIAQLVRINRDVAPKLRLLEHAGPIDEINDFPPSETPAFWQKRISEEIEQRMALGQRVDRSPAAQANDANTLALVQSLANTAARRGEGRRFVLVTADSLLIDVYRSWHCFQAQEYEPFVIRPIRQFAPLLNIVDMTGGRSDGDVEARGKGDIFPALQAAIDPFLLNLNLSSSYRRERAAGRRIRDFQGQTADRIDDYDRWPREMFALRLRRALRSHRASANRTEPESEEKLRREVVDPTLFPGAHFERLALAGDELDAVSKRGRQIERSAIGFGYERLGSRLDALKVAADVLRDFGDKDDTALAVYIRGMVDRFGSANLDLRFQALDIERELSQIVSSDDFQDIGSARVPLGLAITYNQGSVPVPLATRAAENDRGSAQSAAWRCTETARTPFRAGFPGQQPLARRWLPALRPIRLHRAAPGEVDPRAPLRRRGGSPGASFADEQGDGPDRT